MPVFLSLQVKESDLKRVLDCLSYRFKLVCDSESESDLQLVDSVTRSGLNVADSNFCEHVSPSLSPFLCPFDMWCEWCEVIQDKQKLTVFV